MFENDDNENRRGSKSNVGREHKPKDSKDVENAPSGHLGLEVVFTPSPSLAKTIRKARPTNSIENSNLTKVPEKPDNRPLAMKTGDKEVDDHYGKDHRLITEEEISDAKSPEQSREQAKNSSKRKLSAQDIFNKFSKDREHDRGLG